MKTCLFALATMIQAIEPLTLKDNKIHTIASFPSVDFFSTYSREGTFLWEIAFKTKISSFQEDGDHLIFLSHTRDETAYILSCFEKNTGTLIWENAILAPPETEK